MRSHVAVVTAILVSALSLLAYLVMMSARAVVLFGVMLMVMAQ